jgi:serine phosphatase RsbU (regulator of sigma subunit)
MRKPGREHFGALLPWLLIATVLTLELTHDYADVASLRTGSLLTPAPALAAIRGRLREVVAVSAAATVVAAFLIATDVLDGLDYQLTILIAVLIVAVASVAATRAREQREARLYQVRRVAEAAQLAVLPPVPRRARDLRLQARYVAAESEALIGGDLYDVVVGPDSVRLIIGDVRGKGLPAIRTAATVLGTFREAARREPSLSRAAVRCSQAVGRMEEADGDGYSDAYESAELFVTAAVMELRGPELRLVNLGHPAPVLLTRSAVRRVGLGDVLPPLGLAHQFYDEFPVLSDHWEPGDRLLLYTDGIDEARDARGEFFPLMAAMQSMIDVPGDKLPDALVDAVVRHSGQLLRDDAAVVAVEWRPDRY